MHTKWFSTRETTKCCLLVLHLKPCWYDLTWLMCQICWICWHWFQGAFGASNLCNSHICSLHSTYISTILCWWSCNWLSLIHALSYEEWVYSVKNLNENIHSLVISIWDISYKIPPCTWDSCNNFCILSHGCHYH